MPSEQPDPTPAGQSAGDPTAEAIRKQVENEQALADARRKLGELEEQVDKERKQKESLELDKQGADSTAQQLRTQLSALQALFHKATSELSVSQTRLDAMEREKRELIEEIERLQQRSNRTTQELHTLRAHRSETSQKIAHLEVEVSELKMAAESAKFNESRSVQALQNARTEILTLSKSVAEVEERFSLYRVERQADISQIQLENEALAGRVTSAENSYNALQRTYNDQSRRLAEAHANIATLTSAAAAKKASSTNEVSRLLDENRILEKRGDEARATVAEREAELERLVDAQTQIEKSWEARWKKEERLRKEAEKRSEDLKIVVERLSLAQGEGSDLSPAAALASSQRQSGKSYTQFYMDYTIQEGKLRTAENEVLRLTQLLEEISADIAEKKPLLDEQAAEHAVAIERANALAAELASALAARDSAQAEARSLKAASQLRADETASLQTTVDDLSRQVQGLLRQIAIQNDPLLASQPIDGNKVNGEGDIITDHVVEFKSIRSLQEQNKKLLKLTRGLMAKLDAQEINRATDDAADDETGVSLDKATETITKLHAQLLEAQKRISEVTRERDVFSKLLSRGEGLRGPSQNGKGPLDDDSAPQQQLVATLQEEMATVRAKAEQEIAEVRSKFNAKSEEAGQAEVARARAEAQATLLQEQHRMLSDTSALQKQEYINLETQFRQVQASIAQANSERRQALEQAAAKQAEADRLRTEAANLRAEKEQWSSTESRLQSDFRSVQSERARLQHLIDGLNNINSENERTRAEERVRLERRIEELQREATALRGQIDQAKEATRAAEKKVEDFDSRLATATAAVRAEKEAAETLAMTRATELTTLQAELEKVKTESERRLRIGLNHQRRVNEAQAKHEETIAAKDKEIEEINAKIEAVNKEIAEAKTKIEELEKKLAESERVASLKENTVQRLQSELNAVRSGGGEDAAFAVLQAERTQLQEKLEKAENELAAAKAAATAEGASVDDATASASAAATAELQTKVEQLQKEKEAQDQKYQNDVVKVNRVNQQLRDRVNIVQGERANAESRAAELEKQIEELKARASSSAEDGVVDQTKIDEAVEAAIAAKEAQLKAEHAKALEEAKAAVPVAAPSEGDANFEAKVNEAVTAKSAEIEKERDTLRGKIAELETKVKTLERQNKTAEISRKTLERQKTDAEARLKKLEDAAGGTASPASAPAPVSTSTPAPAAAGLSATASAFKPGPPAATPVAPASGTASSGTSSPTAVGSATTTVPARGGPGRGRGRVAALRGRGGAARANSILSNVNATLGAARQPATATTSPATAAAGTVAPTTITAAAGSAGSKRPLSEESETPSGSDATATPAAPAQAAAGGPRQLKRPRGGAAARGGVKRQSGEAGAPGAAPSASGNDAGQGNAGSAGAGAEGSGGAGGA